MDVNVNITLKSRNSHEKCSLEKSPLRKFWLSPATLIKKRLWHRCVPVNSAKFLRTPFLQNTSGRLLLEIKSPWYLHSFFYIRTSKFCLRLAVLNFFHFWGWNVLNLFLFPRLNLQCHKEECQTEYNKTHYFISFILFFSSSAYRQLLKAVLQKIGSATVLKPIKKYLRRNSIFIKVAGFMSATLIKLKFLQRYFS